MKICIITPEIIDFLAFTILLDVKKIREKVFSKLLIGLGQRKKWQKFSNLLRNQTSPNNPKFCLLRQKFAERSQPLLMITWFWWWWNSYDDGAYWVILAVFILATGETRPHYYKFLRPVWVPLSYLIDPIVFLLTQFARFTIPESYRQPQKVLKPLSFKEINKALDDAAAEHEKRKNTE